MFSYRFNLFLYSFSLIKEDSFWESKEFLDTLESGEYLAIDYAFFADHLVTLWNSKPQRERYHTKAHLTVSRERGNEMR
jgi:hypothetical protein